MLERFRKLPRSRQISVVAVFVALAVFGRAGGCIAYERPPALSAEERALLQGTPLPYSVTVAWSGLGDR
jgi:hypothetical protein